MATKTTRTYPLKHVAVEGDTPRSVALASDLQDAAVAFLNEVPRTHEFAEGDEVSLGAGRVYDGVVSVARVEKILSTKKATDDKTVALIQHNLATAGLLKGRFVTGDYNDETADALRLWHVALGREKDGPLDRVVLYALGRGTFSVED
ncbi:hypothetical protein [Terracoccus sp. 273MFTsu3.1]|uniref:hypothetical protein n=1 Tax=Terracoccus sp. 273MFTsu3.1 TaxID=1172188 RepID=UPI0003775B60|nr:hypothetical protein [Terracoccus sp. 273MFTsu3.1]